jgi:arylsulfatase A-like enzyme
MRSSGPCRPAPRAGTNVLFIAVDDLRPQLGCYGNDSVISPNIDALARRGIVFDRAFCQQAVCAASRCSLLSGCRPDTTRVHSFDGRLRDSMPDVRTLPEHFRRNGYETVSVGKVYHRNSDDPQGWSRKPYRAQGAWVSRGYLSPDSISRITSVKTGGRSAKFGPAYEAADVPDGAYPDGVAVERAIGELRRLKGRRFFLALGLHKPHLPFNAPKKYWEVYDRRRLKLAPNPFAPKGAPALAFTNWGELRAYAGMPKQGPVPEAEARRLVHGYHACVTYVDALVGRVLDELKRLDLHRSTAVVLWGDHGWKLGEHVAWCKKTNFELDARVPLIVSAPGMKAAGRRSNALVELVDLYPTLCAGTGLDPPAHLEGTSMRPLLDDPDLPWKKATFSQFPRAAGRVMGRSVRTDRYRYTEWRQVDGGRLLAAELYDHESDSAENVNVAGEPANAETVKKLAAMLQAGWRGALPPAASPEPASRR